MADLSPTESHAPLEVAERPSLRRLSAGFGIVLGGVPLSFGAPTLVGGAIAIVGTVLAIALLPRLEERWEALGDTSWFRLVAVTVFVVGAVGWLYRLLGWTVKFESVWFPIFMALGLEYKFGRAQKESKARPLQKDR